MSKTDFFNGHDYFIDEEIHFFKFGNVYNIFNETGENIGAVKQTVSFGQKLLILLIGKPVLPFKLEIVNNDDELQATISRGWTFLMSKISVSDPDGNELAYIQQKYKLFKPTFRILDTSGQLIAEIKGDWKAWAFQIKDTNDTEIGTINKKWAGAMREIFTHADKYNVHINPDYTQSKHKVAILSAAITIDMVLKNQK